MCKEKEEKDNFPRDFAIPVIDKSQPDIDIED